jgi:hypothetical protein
MNTCTKSQRRWKKLHERSKPRLGESANRILGAHVFGHAAKS